ncbi:hypothetical protein FKP32DRAFT_1676327 [Trametes sanguinea]|nr:hypothetical protein FKP32DRAFT_1676327 [Trametes sanguinea]
MNAHTAFLGALGLLRVALVLAQAPLPAPPITAPRSGDVWDVGSRQTIRWDTAGQPVYNALGMSLTGIIWLGYLTNSSDGSSQVNIWPGSPLAVGFPITNEQVDVIVPDVPTASNYFITGVRDNTLDMSELFSIYNPKDPDATSAEPASISVSTLPFSSVGPPGTASGSASATGSSYATSTISSSNQATATALAGTSTRPSSTPTNAAARVFGNGLAFISSLTTAFLLA